MYQYLPRAMGRTLMHSGATDIAALTGGKALRIYDLQRSTAVSSEYPSVTEVLGGTALAQTDADRKPAAATAANGLNVATFDGTDVWLQTLESGNNGTAKWWMYLRVKPADFAAQQFLYSAMAPGLSGAASAHRARLVTAAANGIPRLDVFMSGTNGRSYSATSVGLTSGSWNSLLVQFDNTRTAEADLDGATSDAKVRLALGNTFLALTATDIGTPGGVPSALLAATGSALLFAGSDADVPSLPLRNGGQTQLMVFGQEPLTAAELAALNLYQFPT